MARPVLLSLRLLGGFQATRAADGSPVEFSNRKVAQLTAYLALNPGKRQDRAQVARAIWPGVGQESALSSLRNALALLRKDLDGQGLPSDEILLADRVSACLAAVATDLQGLLEARAADAARLYQGPLLPEWDGDWIAEARAKARAHVRRESEGLGVEDLVAVHDRDREFEPLLQAAAAALLADGRPTEAVEICRGFARSLRQRTGMLPSEATVSLARQARLAARTRQFEPVSNLPSLPGPLVGRDGQLAAVKELLADPGCRVLTLLGTGGVGKTRLALETAHDLRPSLQGAAWFVDLAGIEEPAQVPRAILSAVAPERDALDPWAAVVETLAPVPLLLILDNLEQFGPGMKSLVEDLVRELPLAQVIATSRTDMRFAGGKVVRLDPLDLPDPTGDPLSAPSVALYVERAQAVAPSFVPDDLDSLARLAGRLEGLPLAICLAAAKADVLSPAETLRQLDDRFALLQTETLPWPDRHRRLWACLDWSYRLAPESHNLLPRLTPFKGGWTVETAASLCPSDPVPAQLQSLLRSCLIAESSRIGHVRFDMAESVRDFVELQQSPEAREEAKCDHARVMLDWLRDPGRSQQAFNAGYLRDRGQEYENLRTAFEWCLANDRAGALQIVSGLAYYWVSREMTPEGLDWVDRALARSDGLDPVSVAMAHRVRSTMLIGVARFAESVKALETALSVLPAEADAIVQARTLNSLGNALMRVERFDEALEAFQRAWTLCDESGASETGLSMRGNAGLCLYLAGRLDEAQAQTEAVVDALAGGDNQDWLSSFLHNLGLIAKAKGDDRQALVRFAEARATSLAVGNSPADRGWLADAAVSAIRVGDLEHARAWVHEGAGAVRLTKGAEQHAECLEAAAALFEATGDDAEAAALLGFLQDNGLVPQRSRADRSPTPAQRLDQLRSRLGSGFGRAATRYRGLSVVELLEEVAEATERPLD